MFRTRSRVLAAARLATVGEQVRSATRKTRQAKIGVLVPGLGPEERKQYKVPTVLKPQPREKPQVDHSTAIDEPVISNSRSIYQALTRRADYRVTLSNNDIRTIPSEEALPENIIQMLKQILPNEPLQVSMQDQGDYHIQRNMAIVGAQEAEVDEYLRSMLLSKTRRLGPVLSRGCNQLLDKSRVPNRRPNDRVSTPKPDYHLGYSSLAFPESTLDVLDRLDSSEIKYPFLEFEIKGDGRRSHGRLWVATSQCLGGTATFLNILDQLKAELRHRSLETEYKALEPIVFNVVTNGTEARLFVSFLDGGGKFWMSLVKGFLFYEDQGFEKLEAYLTKIIEWGAESRLDKIKNALKALSGPSGLVEDPQTATESYLLGSGSAEAGTT